MKCKSKSREKVEILQGQKEYGEKQICEKTKIREKKRSKKQIHSWEKARCNGCLTLENLIAFMALGSLQRRDTAENMANSAS